MPERLYTEFRSVSGVVQNDGTVATGVAGETNIVSIDGVPWEHFIIGTQTILTPTFLAGNNDANPHLNWEQDATATDGWVLTPYANHSRSPLAFIIGTHPAFFVELRVRVVDYSGGNPLNVGFHGSAAAAAMQAQQAVFANYTDKATIGVTNTNDIQIVTALNDAADVTTDTTNDAVDARILRLRVNVSGTGVVTYRIGFNGADADAVPALVAPTATAAFTFDNGDYVVPFIYFIQGGDVTGNLELMRFECGYQ